MAAAPGAARRWTEEPASVELTVEEAAPALPSAPERVERAPAALPAAPLAAAAARALPRTSSLDAARASSTAPSEQDSPPSPSSSPWSFSPTGPADLHAIDVHGAWRPAPVDDHPDAAPAPEPQGPDVPRGLAEQLATRDSRNELGPAGPIVTSLRRATVSRVHREGVAVVRVVFDDAGQVSAVRLLRSSGPSAAWAQVVDAARHAAESTPALRGATVDVRIDATLEHAPAGQTHTIDIRGETWAMGSSDDLRRG
jgi:TonB family protein